MLQKFLTALVFGLGCTAILAADDKPAADDKKAEKGKIDRAKLFARVDANGDGKVTKEEFTKFFETVAERAKSAGKGEKLAGKEDEVAARLFARMDANGDGVVTKDEFEKGGAGGADKGGLKGKGFFKKKD